jgi:hypothetical protein
MLELPPEQSKICSSCHERKPLSEFYRNRSARDGHRARCKACQSTDAAGYHVAHSEEIAARKKHKAAAARVASGIQSVVMLECPDDPVLDVPMYTVPVLFDRTGFQETLACGYWPDGAVFSYAAVYRGEPTRWRVSGRKLTEVDGERVVVARMKHDNRATVELIAAVAADD